MEHLLSEKQVEFRDQVREYFERRLNPIVDDLEKKGEFPLEFYRQLGKDGFLGVNIPVEYGGKGLDSVCSALLLEEVARISAGVALDIFTSMPPSIIILSVGTEEQKMNYLKGITKGEYIVTFCLSEPNAGSYNLGMETTAILDNGSFVINGNKTFITNGSVGNLHVVVAYTDKNKGAKGISIFLVEGNTSGIHVLRKLEKLGWDSSDTAELTFSDVRIPKQNILGKEGTGLLQALDSLNFGRALLGAISLGLAESIFDLCRNYVTSKNPLGQTLSRYQHFRHRLARMSIEVEASALLVWNTMKKRDMGLKYIKEASYCKYFCGNVVRSMALEAMEFFGEEAFMDYHSKVSRCFRDAPVHTIADGTQEMQLEVISREIGLGRESI